MQLLIRATAARVRVAVLYTLLWSFDDLTDAYIPDTLRAVVC